MLNLFEIATGFFKQIRQFVTKLHYHMHGNAIGEEVVNEDFKQALFQGKFDEAEAIASVSKLSFEEGEFIQYRELIFNKKLNVSSYPSLSRWADIDSIELPESAKTIGYTPKKHGFF